MKKFIMKTALVAVLGLSMVSCKSTFYQVYDVDYDSNMKMQDNSLVYENEDCKVLYNLWSEGGFVKFSIINKTDKDIFVNLTQTFFTLNGLANEYYQGRTYSTATYNQVTTASASVNSIAKGVGYGSANAYLSGSGFWGNDTYSWNGNAKSTSSLTKFIKSTTQSVTVKEKEIECIPAKSFKVFGTYSVSPSWQRTCDKEKDFPSKTYLLGSYSKDNTPYTFNNRIAYGFAKNDIAEKHIDNVFWVKAITNYSEKSATEDVKEKSECYGMKTSDKFKRFKIGTPNKFYIVGTTEGGYLIH